MEKGLVIKSTGSFYTVKNKLDEFVICKTRGKLRIKGIKSTNPIAVGDFVFYIYDEINKIGVINKIEDRKNCIVRKSINLSKQTHVLAANIDIAFLVITLSIPETTTMFIDRFLVSAEAYRIPVVLLFNKMDIYQDADLERVDLYKQIYSSAGYKSISVSAITKTNIEQLKELMINKTSVFVGHSGVGKSSLVKAIAPQIDLKISNISHTHLTGKHTTTFAEMFEWKKNSYIADTPGIKAFGLTDFKKDEISHHFPEIFQASHQCKFQNCTHSHEPNCYVKEAVEEGLIPNSRYKNYILMLEDNEENYR